MSGFGDHQRRLFRRCLGATGGLALGLAAILAAVLEPAAGESPLFLSTTMFGLLALSVLRPSFDLWSRHLFAGVGVAVITYAAAVEGGGLEAPALFALPLLPVVMSFLSGSRAAAAWAAVVCASIAGLWALGDRLDRAAVSPEALEIARPLVICTVVGLALLVGLAYRAAVDGQERSLASARDKALAASTAKSAFLATMSHEIRTPLAGILGIVELLESQPLLDEQREKMALLRRAADGLTALIGNVLDISAIEAGRLVLRPEPVELGALCRDAGGLFSVNAEQRGSELRILGADRDAPSRWVEVDGRRLRQVLLNLVSNAVKFTERGSVQIELRTALRGDGDLDVELAVADTGPGIPEAGRAALFDPFTQLDSTASRRHQGSGLGLAIARKLTVTLGGSLVLESEEGRGSTFRIALTLSVCEPPAAVEPAPTQAPRGPLCVLVVEDNDINQIIIAALLQERGGHSGRGGRGG